MGGTVKLSTGDAMNLKWSNRETATTYKWLLNDPDILDALKESITDLIFGFVSEANLPYEIAQVIKDIVRYNLPKTYEACYYTSMMQIALENIDFKSIAYVLVDKYSDYIEKELELR